MKTVKIIEHGTVANYRTDFFGYFGWPTITRMDDGTLVVVASGLRNGHVCPFGRTSISFSQDQGKTWTHPRIITDTPLDDRDAGAVCVGGLTLLVTWFITDNRPIVERLVQQFAAGEVKDAVQVARWQDGVRDVNDTVSIRWSGAWTRISDDGGITWGNPTRVRLTTPHGPIRLRSGNLLFLGKEYGPTIETFRKGSGDIMSMASSDRGRSWSDGGRVPLFPGTDCTQYHEPHVVELPDGRLIGHIRFHASDAQKPELGADGSLMQTESRDGGVTWSPCRPLGWHGMPAHLIQHSSGTLVSVYGYRHQPYGQRLALSDDGGATWRHDQVLRDDGPTWDLGYPSSVELPGGDLLTVYYQQPAAPTDKCGILWTRWKLE